LVLLNPGSETNPTCKIDELGLSADYEKRGDDYLFNFQHLLFLMRRPQETGLSTFRLECSVEICEKNDASSKCNSAAAVCVDASAGEDTSLAATEKDKYMCDGLCESEKVCVIQNNTPSCDDPCQCPGGGTCSYNNGVTSCVAPADYGCGCTGDVLNDADPGCPADAPGYCQYFNFEIGRLGKRNKLSEITGITMAVEGVHQGYTGPLLGNVDNPYVFSALPNLDIIWFASYVGVQGWGPYGIISDSVTRIKFKAQAYRDQDLGRALDEIGYTRPTKSCEKDPVHFTLRDWKTAFPKKAFAGLPNLEELILYGGQGLEGFDAAYFAEEIPKLKRIYLHFTNFGTKCHCGGDPGTYCHQCANVPFCQELCGIHPTMENCFTNSNVRLFCDKSLTANNGTWYISDEPMSVNSYLETNDCHKRY